MTFKHGASAYRSGGIRCRCQVCRAASTERHRREQAARAERLRADPTLAEHGLAQTYTNWGCRCEPCTEANRSRCFDDRQRRRAVAGGGTR